MAALHKEAIAPRSVSKSAKKIGDAAKKGELVQMPEPKKKPELGVDREPTEMTFSKAHEVHTVADQLIERGLPHMATVKQARILYIFSSADHIAGCEEAIAVSRYPRKLLPLGKFDFIVMVSGPRWQRSEKDVEWRKALVYHGLSHIDNDENGRWLIARHEFTGFLAELNTFGAWTESLTRVKQLDLFAKD